MNPMVDQVDKIIYNLLASELAVHIPSVGSLLVERVPARYLSKRRIAPPYYTVIFTSHSVGTSLVDAIAYAASCDQTEAQEILQRWLSHTMQQDTLTIEGVGVLRQKSFAVNPVYDKIINPQERTPISVQSSGNHWLFWTVASVAIICGIGACGWILYDRMIEDQFPEPLEYYDEVAELPATTASDSLSVAVQSGIIDTLSVVSGEVVTSTPAVSPPTPQESLTPEKTVVGNHYVVLGVFSSEENARRAAQEALSIDPSLRCGVWFYGPKFMVSLFASADEAACAEFVRTHADRYPEAWSYRAR